MHLNLELVHSTDLATTLLSFEHAIKIFINKPQVVNKWVAGSTLLDLATVEVDNYLPGLHTDASKIEYRQFLSKSRKAFRDIKYLIVDELETSGSVLFVPVLDRDESAQSSLKYPAVSFAHRFELNTNSNKLNVYADKTGQLAAQLTWLTATLTPKLATWSRHYELFNVNFDFGVKYI